MKFSTSIAVTLFVYKMLPEARSINGSTVVSKCSLAVLDAPYSLTGMLLLDTISYGLTCSDCDHWDKCDGVTVKVSSGTAVLVVEDAGDYTRGNLIQIERPTGSVMRKIELDLSHHSPIKISMNYGTCNQNQLANCHKKSARVCLSLPKIKSFECNQNFSGLNCTYLVGSNVQIVKSAANFPFASKYLYACTTTDSQKYKNFCEALRKQKFPSYFSSQCDEKSPLRLFRGDHEFKSTSSFYWDVNSEPKFKFSFKFIGNMQINVSFFYVNPLPALNVYAEHVSKAKSFEPVPGAGGLMAGASGSNDIILSSKDFERIGAEVMVALKGVTATGRELVAYFTVSLMSSKLGFSMSFNQSSTAGSIFVQCRPVGKNVGKQCRIQCLWVLVDGKQSSNIINSSHITTDSKSIDSGSHECRCSFECYPKSGVYGPWIFKTKSSAHLQSQIVKQTWWVISIVSMIAVLIVILLIVFSVRWLLNRKISAKKRLYGSDMPKSRTAT
uniref:Uncharacterized protein n=1 Tax=Romanomermis culicivorax TaxID=13658 RepID=A0A915HUZ0_ROMCU